MKRSLLLLAKTSALTLALLGAGAVSAGAAHADITRCVGAVDTPGAFACWTSPRFDHIGLERETLATMPVVCYGYGCTAGELQFFVPGGEVGGRFIAVSYLDKTYTVYRPTSAQPYIIASGGTFTPAQEAQVLLLAGALAATEA